MWGFISFVLLAAVVIPSATGLIIMLRNELEIKDKVTGGFGIIPICGFMLVFVAMPVLAYFVKF